MEMIGADNPVGVASFRIPEGDRFYENRWRYGKSRLEFALRNAFDRVGLQTCALCAINPHHMRVIILSREYRSEMQAYIDIIRQIRKVRLILDRGFDLSLHIKWINAYPDLLSFAAGAMIYVVVEELIPEMSAGEHSNIGTIAFAAGFTAMMILDVALG